jgi:hypothetical protein
MKPQQLFPVLAAAIGFSIAWVVKPSGSPSSSPAAAEMPPAGKPARSDNPRPRPASITEKRPKEVNAGDFPLVDQAELGPKTRSEAKMLRLAEALGLTIDQQGRIIKALEDAKAAATDSVPVLVDLTTRGKSLEETLGKILNPQQLAKFEELRVRERENRIEARAQKSLSQIIEEIDLSPGQRDDVLARLRQAAKAEIQTVPAAATLLLNTSLLPTDSKDLSIDGALVLEKISEEPDTPDDPAATHQKVIRRQRQELEERLRCFDGILTSGQMGQVHAALAESRANLDFMEQYRKERQPKAVPLPPGTTPFKEPPLPPDTEAPPSPDE